MDLLGPGCNTDQGGCSDRDIFSGDTSLQCGDTQVGGVGEVPVPHHLQEHLVGCGGQAFLPALPTSFFFISSASSRHVSATAAFR